MGCIKAFPLKNGSKTNGSDAPPPKQERLIDSGLRGAPRGQKMLKGHLPGVVYHQVFQYPKITHWFRRSEYPNRAQMSSHTRCMRPGFRWFQSALGLVNYVPVVGDLKGFEASPKCSASTSPPPHLCQTARAPPNLYHCLCLIASRSFSLPLSLSLSLPPFTCQSNHAVLPMWRAPSHSTVSGNSDRRGKV